MMPDFSTLPIPTKNVPMIEVTIESAPITSGNDVAPGIAPSTVAEQHRGRRRDDVGLEEIGGHAGAIADVVADVVGDHGRVARIVFGDAGFDFADEVGADVGGLGEDAAAETGEDRDQRAAEREADQRGDRVRSSPLLTCSMIA